MVVVVVGGCVWRVAGGGQRGRGARIFQHCPIPATSLRPIPPTAHSWAAVSGRTAPLSPLPPTCPPLSPPSLLQHTPGQLALAALRSGVKKGAGGIPQYLERVVRQVRAGGGGLMMGTNNLNEGRDCRLYLVEINPSPYAALPASY